MDNYKVVEVNII